MKALPLAMLMLAACASQPSPCPYAVIDGVQLGVSARKPVVDSRPKSWLPTQPHGRACLDGQDVCPNPDRSAGGCCAAGTVCCSRGCCP